MLPLNVTESLNKSIVNKHLIFYTSI